MGSSIEWRCFHCDEVFTDREAAAEHFGTWQAQEPACTIDIAEFRKLEKELESWRNEGHEIQVAMQTMTSKHATELRREEERGYDKGVQEGKKYFIDQQEKLENLTSEQNTALIVANEQKQEAPLKISFGDPRHFIFTIGIGADHTASLIIDEEALFELEKRNVVRKWKIY